MSAMPEHQAYTRPQTLADVAERVLTHGLATYTATIKEFLDEYRALKRSQSVEATRAARIQMVQATPKAFNHAIFNAHIAGLAEHILFDNDVPPAEWPAWIDAPERFLAEPAYFGGKHARDHLMIETPAAFRRRLLFCGRVYL